MANYNQKELKKTTMQKETLYSDGNILILFVIGKICSNSVRRIYIKEKCVFFKKKNLTNGRYFLIDICNF